MLGLVMAVVGVSDLATGFISGAGITPDQVGAVQGALPQAVEGIKDSIRGNNIFGAITALAGFVTAIWRKWFTNTVLT